MRHRFAAPDARVAVVDVALLRRQWGRQFVLTLVVLFPSLLTLDEERISGDTDEAIVASGLEQEQAQKLQEQARTELLRQRHLLPLLLLPTHHIPTPAQIRCTQRCVPAACR